MSAAQKLLDSVHSLAQLDAVVPGAYAAHVADELGPAPQTLDALDKDDARFREALARLDGMIERAARIRLEHALASDTSIAAPTRKVFATTVVAYDGRLELLAQRAHDVAARGGAADPAAVASDVVASARSALELRAAMRDRVLAVVRDRAAAAVPDADRAARDRSLDDATRKRWSAARRDLEMVAARPELLLAAPRSERAAALPDQLDEPEPARELTRGELLELD